MDSLSATQKKEPPKRRLFLGGGERGYLAPWFDQREPEGARTGMCEAIPAYDVPLHTAAQLAVICHFSERLIALVQLSKRSFGHDSASVHQEDNVAFLDGLEPMRHNNDGLGP